MSCQVGGAMGSLLTSAALHVARSPRTFCIAWNRCRVMLLTSILRWAVTCCCQAELIAIAQIASRAAAVRPNKASRVNCTDEKKLRIDRLQLMRGSQRMGRHQFPPEKCIFRR